VFFKSMTKIVKPCSKREVFLGLYREVDVPFLSVAPILPTADMERMQTHYEALGFIVKVHHGGYATAARDGFNVRFGLREQVTEPGALYFSVSDVDALHAEWATAGVGQTGEVFDPGFGVREAAHIDPDGNIIRFGSKPGQN
jgi:catechol 2,3-dioxygenase-like lactoylglutathione lyase family enzyme